MARQKTKRLRRFALKMKRSPTIPEARLYEAMARAGIQFEIQAVFPPYIVDAFIRSKKVVVEVDGKHHLGGFQKQYDDKRTKILERAGIVVLRYLNSEIEDHERLAQVVREIASFCTDEWTPRLSDAQARKDRMRQAFERYNRSRLFDLQIPEIEQHFRSIKEEACRKN